MTAPAGVDRDVLSGELARAHAEIREELGRANTTALGVAGTVATLAGVGLAVLLAGDWAPSSLPTVGQVAWWAGSVATLVSLAVLAAVVKPGMPPTSPGQPPTHWGAIAGYTGASEDLAAALVTLAADPAPRVIHLIEMATLAARKWAKLRAGLTVLTAAAVLLALAGLSGLVGG